MTSSANGVSKSLLFQIRRTNDETPEQSGMKAVDAINCKKTAVCQVQIQRLLQCIICMDPSASPIHTCMDNGHLICGFCHDKLKASVAICPLCKCKELFPNPLGERQSRQNDMLGKCPFSDSGCTEAVLAAVMVDHVKTCEYREIQCTRARIGDLYGEPCNKMFRLDEFPLHAFNVHKTNSHKNKNSMIVSYRFNVPFKAGNEQSDNFWDKPPDGLGYLNFEHDGKYFAMHQAIGNNMFYWWVTIFGGQKEADRYRYQTELVWENTDEQKDKNATVVLTLPVLPYHLYEKYDKSCGNCATVHAATATAYAEKRADDPQIRILSFRIKMFKTEGTKRPAEMSTDSKAKKSK